MKNFSDNLIKILSLGIGLAIGIVLIAKVCFELSYDSFYKDVDRIYLIKAETVLGDKQDDFDQISGAVAPGFKAEVPGVEDPGSWRSLSPLDKGFANYGAEGERLQRRIELYLLDIGITPDEIATFKSIMLDEDK